MNKSINYVLIFSLGAAAGAGVTWKLLKTKYERITNEEIREVREYYANKHKDNLEELSASVEELKETIENAEVEDTKVRDYNDIVKKEGYVDYSDIKIKEKGDVEESFEGPVIISEDEFGMDPEYDTDSFIFYTDEVLADRNNNIINTADEIVGTEYIFAIEDEDVVYIRNDELEMYYEIVKDSGAYADMIPYDPHSEE